MNSSSLANVAPFMPKYIGRPSSASPSTGFKKVHDIEQAILIKQTLRLP
jgi:hypothetical protein